jgi:hypothetical protein
MRNNNKLSGLVHSYKYNENVYFCKKIKSSMPILNFFKSFKIFFRYESNFHSPGKIKLNDNLSINLFYI